MTPELSIPFNNLNCPSLSFAESHLEQRHVYFQSLPAHPQGNGPFVKGVSPQCHVHTQSFYAADSPWWVGYSLAQACKDPYSQ